MITALIIVWCSSSMEAPQSTPSRLSGASGWTWSPWESCSLRAWSPEGRLEAPPGLSPLNPVPLETTPRCHRQDEGRWKSGLDRYPCPTSPGSRPMIHRYGLVAACIIMFSVRESSATKESYELLWYPNTYDLPGGLTLGNHSSSPSSAAVELSGR